MASGNVVELVGEGDCVAMSDVVCGDVAEGSEEVDRVVGVEEEVERIGVGSQVCDLKR